MDKIVIASGNQHKIEEFRTLFAPLGITVIGMKECGTFAEPGRNQERRLRPTP